MGPTSTASPLSPACMPRDSECYIRRITTIQEVPRSRFAWEKCRCHAGPSGQELSSLAGSVRLLDQTIAVAAVVRPILLRLDLAARRRMQCSAAASSENREFYSRTLLFGRGAMGVCCLSLPLPAAMCPCHNLGARGSARCLLAK